MYMKGVYADMIKVLVAMALAMAGSQAQALFITPSDCDDFGGSIECDTGNDPSNSELVSYIEMNFGVIELYKENTPDNAGDPDDESGPFADSYDTTFANSETDPEDATVTYTGTGGDSISCPECWLLVKDGNHDPAWYLFNIVNWDGEEIIELRDFWPEGTGDDGKPLGGAISYVSIFGGPPGTNVPLPGPLSLLCIGLFGVCIRQLKKAS
jgi:hypothetical protein